MVNQLILNNCYVQYRELIIHKCRFKQCSPRMGRTDWKTKKKGEESRKKEKQGSQILNFPFLNFLFPKYCSLFLNSEIISSLLSLSPDGNGKKKSVVRYFGILIIKFLSTFVKSSKKYCSISQNVK